MTYALADIKTGGILQQYTAAPDLVVWPNGDASHAPVLGDERAGARLVIVEWGPEPPGEFYVSNGVTPELKGTTLYLRTDWRPVDLTNVKNALLARIDSGAEAARLRRISDGVGQALTYFQKFSEARDYLNDPNPDPAMYPVLAASIIGDATLAETARLVFKTGSQWIAVSAQIEAVRLPAKAAVGAAKTVDEAVAAAASLVWP